MKFPSIKKKYIMPFPASTNGCICSDSLQNEKEKDGREAWQNWGQQRWGERDEETSYPGSSTRMFHPLNAILPPKSM